MELGASIPPEFTVLDMRSQDMGKGMIWDWKGHKHAALGALASACYGTAFS